MTRRKLLAETVRLNLQLHPSVRDQILRLRETLDADTMTEVIRRSLALHELLLNKQAEGYKLLLQNGKSTTEIVIVS